MRTLATVLLLSVVGLLAVDMRPDSVPRAEAVVVHRSGRTAGPVNPATVQVAFLRNGRRSSLAARSSTCTALAAFSCASGRSDTSIVPP